MRMNNAFRKFIGIALLCAGTSFGHESGHEEGNGMLNAMLQIALPPCIDYKVTISEDGEGKKVVNLECVEANPDIESGDLNRLLTPEPAQEPGSDLTQKP